jgi:comEA protein|uniref:Helix-hairpin-helix domain-containing protein n=1 Tax=candidate division WOR-3 bacterium TaxID=2052148 RepID=A0A7V3PSW3_UNCW3
MNKRELVVIIFLSAVFLSGAIINTYKRWQLKRKIAGSPVELVNSESASPDTLIDINAATPEQLDALPGIGPALAQRIITYRQTHGGFKSINEIRNINGIGPKKFAAIKDLITCRPIKSGKN